LNLNFSKVGVRQGCGASLFLFLFKKIIKAGGVAQMLEHQAFDEAVLRSLSCKLLKDLTK